MATQISLSAQFACAVGALAVVDERWPVLEHYVGTAASAHVAGSKPVLADDVDKAIHLLAEVSESVSRLGLISKNEILEDVSTGSLVYVVLPYLLARARARVQGDGRLDALREARSEISVFFEKLDGLGLLTASARGKLHGTEQGSRKRKTLVRAREEKIARFREERRAEQIVKSLAEEARSGDDEDARREAVLLILASAQRRAEDELEGIDREIEVLEYAKRTRERGQDPRLIAQREKEKAPRAVLDGLPPTFRITNRREEARKAVFRPDHSLPTYTIEEWGEIERARAVKAAQEQQQRDIVKAKTQDEEEHADTDVAADRKTMEQRAWDNWRDEHNRGSGNTMR